MAMGFMARGLSMDLIIKRGCWIFVSATRLNIGVLLFDNENGYHCDVTNFIERA